MQAGADVMIQTGPRRGQQRFRGSSSAALWTVCGRTRARDDSGAHVGCSAGCLTRQRRYGDDRTSPAGRCLSRRSCASAESVHASPAAGRAPAPSFVRQIAVGQPQPQRLGRTHGRVIHAPEENTQPSPGPLHILRGTLNQSGKPFGLEGFRLSGDDVELGYLRGGGRAIGVALPVRSVPGTSGWAPALRAIWEPRCS